MTREMKRAGDKSAQPHPESDVIPPCRGDRRCGREGRRALSTSGEQAQPRFQARTMTQELLAAGQGFRRQGLQPITNESRNQGPKAD
jgi:hypothetical protein